MIVGGLMLNLVVCGAIFRPLEEVDRTLTTVSADSHLPELTVTNQITLLSSSESLEEVEDALVDNDPFSFSNDRPLSTLSRCSGPLSRSLILLPTYLTGSDYASEPELLRVIKTRGDRLLSEGHGQPDTERSHLGVASRTTNGGLSCDSGVTASDNNSSSGRDDRSVVVAVEIARTEEVRTALPTSAVLGDGFQRDPLLRLCREDVFCRRGLLQARFLLARGHMSSCPDIYLNTVEGRPLQGRLKALLLSRRAVVRMLRETFDLSIFKSTTFNYFCLHSMLLYMSYNNPYIYLPDKAAEHGIPDDSASTLVAIVGITSTVGQIVMGFVGDRPRVDTFLFYSVMISMAGVVTLFVPLFTTFPYLAFYSATYGFFISANYALTSIILVDILSLEQLTNSFGVVSSAGGLAVLIGPPFAGWISDQTGSYKSTFYISGVTILFSGCMLFFVPCLRRKACCRPSDAKLPSCKQLCVQENK